MTDVASTGDRLLRPVFPGGGSSGIPSHMGPRKKLHSKTGFNLAISIVNGNRLKVLGKMDHDADGDDALELDSEELGEVRILGLKSNHFVAMDQDGMVYAEPNRNSEATIFFETLNNGWNSYASKLNAEKGWYLGIKKSGKAKRGHRTAQGQKATLFIPRPVDPASIPP